MALRRPGGREGPVDQGVASSGGTNGAWKCCLPKLHKPPSREFPMPAIVEAALRSHPARPTHPDAMSRCIEACYICAGTCTARPDACLSARDVEGLLGCLRQNLDCAAICL